MQVLMFTRDTDVALCGRQPLEEALIRQVLQYLLAWGSVGPVCKLAILTAPFSRTMRWELNLVAMIRQRTMLTC
jgi:hypothetical protein